MFYFLFSYIMKSFKLLGAGLLFAGASLGSPQKASAQVFPQETKFNIDLWTQPKFFYVDTVATMAWPLLRTLWDHSFNTAMIWNGPLWNQEAWRKFAWKANVNKLYGKNASDWGKGQSFALSASKIAETTVWDLSICNTFFLDKNTIDEHKGVSSWVITDWNIVADPVFSGDNFVAQPVFHLSVWWEASDKPTLVNTKWVFWNTGVGANLLWVLGEATLTARWSFTFGSNSQEDRLQPWGMWSGLAQYTYADTDLGVGGNVAKTSQGTSSSLFFILTTGGEKKYQGTAYVQSGRNFMSWQETTIYWWEMEIPVIWNAVLLKVTWSYNVEGSTKNHTDVGVHIVGQF